MGITIDITWEVKAFLKFLFTLKCQFQNYPDGTQTSNKVRCSCFFPTSRHPPPGRHTSHEHWTRSSVANCFQLKVAKTGS